MKFLRGLFLASLLLFASASNADVRQPRGFDGKVYQASMALYGTLPKGTVFEDDTVQEEDVTHFICTVTAFKKVKGGYALIGAGHCTGAANPDALPKQLVYSVSDNIGTQLYHVQLLKAVMTEEGPDYEDFAVYLLKTDRKYSVIPLGDESAVSIGSPTVNVNFSLGQKMTKQLTRGNVASVVARFPSSVAGMMLIQQFDSHGASGSSVVSEKTHKVIGLVIGGYDGTTTPSVIEPISRIKADVDAVQLP